MNQECRFRIKHPHQLLVATIPAHVVHDQFKSVGIVGDPLRSLYARFSPDPKGLAHLRGMWNAMKAGGPANNLLIDAHAIALLGLMMIEATDVNKYVNAPTLDNPRLSRVIDYIEVHFGAPLQISNLAKIAAMSPVHFGRSFKQAIGHSPYQYLINRRVEHSSRLLRAGTLSVTEIAYLCGFASPAHFSTLFCKSVGVPPSKFRDKFKS